MSELMQQMCSHLPFRVLTHFKMTQKITSNDSEKKKNLILRKLFQMLPFPSTFSNAILQNLHNTVNLINRNMAIVTEECASWYMYVFLLPPLIIKCDRLVCHPGTPHLRKSGGT